ncbi:MAG: hypothetical protein LAO20_15610 [Acidobacteriia bacterium]|nr:hypothetical protein [Terriglobia bacterium]
MPSKPVFRVLAVVLLTGISCSAQILSLGKVTDPECRNLQQQYADQLQQIAGDASAIHFPFPFYFSQTLDIDEVRQKQLPQGSIHFERVNGQIALAITGNYYISYSAEALTKNARAHRTFQDVVLPILKAAVARSGRAMPFESYAFEVSHHVRSKVLKVGTEGPENLMLFLPRPVADRLAQAKDVEGQQAALLDGEAYVNGEPLTLWLTGDDAPADVRDRYLARHSRDKKPATLAAAEPAEPGTLVSPHLLPQSDLLSKVRDSKNAPHDVSSVELEKLQTMHEASVRKLVADLNAQAHFVDYAPPAFVAFHDGAYLQLSMNTDLEQPAGSSQYRIAALAFDNHIAHLLRAVSKYFHEGARFDGINFSTTVHQAAQPASLSVEYVVPFAALVCYEKYDCTGQELINRSIVLINGERVTLDLQRAEADYNGK